MEMFLINKSFLVMVFLFIDNVICFKMVVSILLVKWRLFWLFFFCVFYCYCVCDEEVYLIFFSFYGVIFVFEYVVCGIFFVYFGYFVIFVIFLWMCILFYLFLLLRILSMDNGFFFIVVIFEYWNLYLEGCGIEKYVMLLIIIFFLFLVNVKFVSLIGVWFVLFWENSCCLCFE